jgi:hypothetical protein
MPACPTAEFLQAPAARQDPADGFTGNAQRRPHGSRLGAGLRRSQNTQLPANCCGRKAQLDGKFSAFCGFGIKPGYRSCERDLGVLGNHPAVQNMLLAARAFSSRRKPRPLSACRPACTHMPCYRSATPWDGLGQYAASRSPMSSARIGGGGSLTGICSDGKPGMCCSDRRLSESRRIHTPRTG